MDKLKMRIQEKSHEMDIDQPSVSAWENLKSQLRSTEFDTFKNHIAANSEELDIEMPQPHTWEKIGQAISRKPGRIYTIRKRLIYLSAACIIVVIGLGITRNINKGALEQEPVITAESPKEVIPVIDSISETKNEVATAARVTKPARKPTIRKERKMVAAKATPKQPDQSLPPEVLQMQKDYEGLIARQINYTKHLAVYGESVDYFQRFMNDFKLLDKQEKELRLLIAQNGMQENSIEDLGMIYQQKLTVLKKLQNEINKTSSRNRNLTDTIPAYISL
jgi:hypothetical protein